MASATPEIEVDYVTYTTPHYAPDPLVIDIELSPRPAEPILPPQYAALRAAATAHASREPAAAPGFSVTRADGSLLTEIDSPLSG